MKALRFLSLLFFVLQVYFVIWGNQVFDMYTNPTGLFLSAAGLTICFFISIRSTDYSSFSAYKVNKTFRFGAMAFVLICFVCCLPDIRSLFSRYLIPDVIQHSDVLPLIIKQYEYFIHGKMPYQFIELSTHTAYPAYMPLHWLPVGISDSFGKDPRWGGILLLLLSSLVFAFLSVRKQKSLPINILLTLLPGAVFYIFVLYASSDIAITYETVIAAYYFFLAIALMQKNITLVVVGIVLCLLSRYTLIFWLPLFFLLYLFNNGMRKTAIYTGIIITIVCVLFVFPFLLRNPSLIIDSLAYHNFAAIADWSDHKYTFGWGVYFGPQIDHLVDGTPEHKVFAARIIQASTMLLLLFTGLFYYARNKHRVNFYEVSLGMLYAVIVGFYMFGPFAFRYYMMAPIYISIVLLARILLSEKRVSK
ncbi:MAG: hypothetical protein WC716_07795 [Chitinophagaceae bacterium]|jgi:hypothetical protein